MTACCNYEKSSQSSFLIFAGRTSKQCRDRWNGHLDPTVSKNPFTSKEDELLLKLCIRFQRSWTKVAERMEGRTENMVRSRFIQIEQWLRKPSKLSRISHITIERFPHRT